MIKPLVSIIIPCYNRADIIEPAIASVQAQTFQDWELIVLDDGSSDNIRGIMTYVDSRDGSPQDAAGRHDAPAQHLTSEHPY